MNTTPTGASKIIRDSGGFYFLRTTKGGEMRWVKEVEWACKMTERRANGIAKKYRKRFMACVTDVEILDAPSEKAIPSQQTIDIEVVFEKAV